MGFNYFPLSSGQVARRRPAWEGLASRRAFGRAAIRFCSEVPDKATFEAEVPLAEQVPLQARGAARPEWDAQIQQQIRAMHLAALSRRQDDTFPAINIPRSIFGQSQALAEIFRCQLIAQESEPGLLFPVPWIESTADVMRLKPMPLKQCRYANAIEFAGYAYRAAGGQLPIRTPVMTGPLDTANYVLGTTRLMEWISTEPQALGMLLRMITEVLVDILQALKKATDGRICPETCHALPHGFGVCSEVRALISSAAYAEYEAPYLQQLGQACGPCAVHGCGSWERTVSSVVDDPNIMLINFQCREMDLPQVCSLAQNRLSLSVGRSTHLSERYTWPDSRSFYRYVIASLPCALPVELLIDDPDLEALDFSAVQAELRGGPAGLFQWQPEAAVKRC